MASTQKGKKPKLPNLVRSIDLRIEFADLVRVASGPDGILLSFCQSTPHGDEILITNDIMIPERVARAMFSILGAQLNAIEKQRSGDKKK